MDSNTIEIPPLKIIQKKRTLDDEVTFVQPPLKATKSAKKVNHCPVFAKQIFMDMPLDSNASSKPFDYNSVLSPPYDKCASLILNTYSHLKDDIAKLGTKEDGDVVLLFALSDERNINFMTSPHTQVKNPYSTYVIIHGIPRFDAQRELPYFFKVPIKLDIEPHFEPNGVSIGKLLGHLCRSSLDQSLVLSVVNAIMLSCHEIIDLLYRDSFSPRSPSYALGPKSLLEINDKTLVRQLNENYVKHLINFDLKTLLNKQLNANATCRDAFISKLLKRTLKTIQDFFSNSETMSTQVDVKVPTEFEIIISNALKTLGFQCNHKPDDSLPVDIRGPSEKLLTVTISTINFEPFAYKSNISSNAPPLSNRTYICHSPK
jgi:hypothetical protein